jgi:hypothetical protein
LTLNYRCHLSKFRGLVVPDYSYADCRPKWRSSREWRQKTRKTESKWCHPWIACLKRLIKLAKEWEEIEYKK